VKSSRKPKPTSRPRNSTVFRTFWHGNALSPYEIACLTSFIAHGHEVEVFVYSDLEAPTGVRLRDAREILPFEQFFLIGGKVAAFADVFRYNMLYKLGGWWVDSDVLCLTAKPPRSIVYFGWQDDVLINNAIMRMPPRHPLAAWLVREAAALGHPNAWGVLGPHLLTKGVRVLGLEKYAMAPEQVYPIPWGDAMQLHDPAVTEVLKKRIEKVPFLHIWNEIMALNKIDKQQAPPKGSALSDLTKDYWPNMRQ
jgi:mannosyltransferase OCH1-like enzyme